jgi:outer membrane protein TolC
VKAQISLEIDTVLSRIRMDRQRLETGRKGREVALRTMEGEMKRLAEGVSTSYQVLQYEKEYSQARSRELAALQDLNKDQVDLWLVSGQLLEKRGIIVEGDAATEPGGNK